MLVVTESAKQLLKNTLQLHCDDPENSLRLSMDPGGQLGLKLGNKLENDHVVEHEGTRVLLVASELNPVLDGVTLDVQDTVDGPELIFSKEKKNNSKD